MRVLFLSLPKINYGDMRELGRFTETVKSIGHHDCRQLDATQGVGIYGCLNLQNRTSFSYQTLEFSESDLGYKG